MFKGAFKKLSGSCVYHFLYLYFIREILRCPCSSPLKTTARFLSGASPYGEYPPSPTGSLSHTDTEVFTPHLFHTLPPSLHQCLLEQLKLKGERQTFFNTTAFFIYFDELFQDFYAFQYGCLNAYGYQNNSKKCKLTPT